MKSRRIKISIEEYHRLPFSPIWKQEYLNGHLVESPREVVAHATIPVAPRAVPNPVPLRAVEPEDQNRLLPCFLESFAEAFEFCDYTPEKFEKSARESLRHFFAGLFHRPLLTASRVALEPPGVANAGGIIGAALLLEQDPGWALLDMIFVSLAWQRGGVATALASAALTALSEAGGCRTLVSRYHLGNEASRAWHHRFGFADEPDLQIAQLSLRAADHELRRQRELNTLTPPVERKLAAERKRWQREVDRLEALIETGHEEEAWPWRKWRRKDKG